MTLANLRKKKKKKKLALRCPGRVGVGRTAVCVMLVESGFDALGVENNPGGVVKINAGDCPVKLIVMTGCTLSHLLPLW